MAPIRLRHIHLPSSPATSLYPTYQTAAALQELLRRRLLDYKDAETRTTSQSPPYPALISFTPQPTYTLGRRQASPSSALTAEALTRLKAPLSIPPSSPPQPFRPKVFTSPRGGLATYHGPGQIVLWPVMAIHSASRLGYKSFRVRCYARLLEATTIAVLQRRFGLRAFTTDDPGVWVAGRRRDDDDDNEGAGSPRKIAALGIHLRRHVSSLGAAVNLDMPTALGGEQGAGEREEERGNPWARFVACGLEGKGVTCVQEEVRAAAGGLGVAGAVDGEGVARAWAEELALRMELDPGAVEDVKGEEVEELVRMAGQEGWMDVVARDEV